MAVRASRETAAIDFRSLACAGVLLALAGVTILLVFTAKPRGLWSDAASVRKPGALEKLVAEATNAAPKLATGIFDNLTTEEDEASLVVKVPRSVQPAGGNIFDAMVHHLRPGETISFGAGRASLEYVAIGYGPPTGNLSQESSVRVPGRYFDGSLEPMSVETVEKRFDAWQRRRSFRGRFPEVWFAVRLGGVPDINVLGGQVLDARTGESLCSGYSYGPDGPLAYLETAVEVWYPTPVCVVIDVAHGPLETEDVIPEAGLQIPHAWGLMQLTAIRAGEETCFSSTSDNKVDEVRVQFKTDSDKKGTTFVFVGWPRAHPIPVAFDILGEAGRLLPGAGGGSSSMVKVQSIRANRDEIRKLRIKRFPHVRRIVLHLPELPGLPESNRGVENLLDVKVPHVWFRDIWEMRQFVERALQLNSPGIQPGTPPPGYFPRAYTNATLREIFMDCLALQPGRVQVRIDSERHRIELLPPFWMRWLERFRKVLHM